VQLIPVLCPRFHSHGTLLHKLYVDRQRESFFWTAKYQQVFDTLNEQRTSAPILTMPDNESQFILDKCVSVYWGCFEPNAKREYENVAYEFFRLPGLTFVIGDTRF